jgi:pimeloyl-ACP methyl ester carboxylesterase
MGFCSGATMTAIFASRNEVGSLILDGCFIDDGTMVIRQGEYIHVPGWLTRLLIPGGMLTTRLMYGFHRIDAIDVMPEIKCPVLFIHESLDAFTTAAETQRMLRAAPNPAKDYLEIPGATHSQGFIINPQVYIDKIDGFLKNLE